MTVKLLSEPFARDSRGLSSWMEVALVGLTLVYSGNPAPGSILPLEPQLVCLAVFLGILLLRRSRGAIPKDFALVAMIFAAVLLIQCMSFSFYPVVTIAGFFVRLFIGYAIVRRVRDFPAVYVRTMVGLAILSFVFYIPYAVLLKIGINVDAPITHISTLLHTASIARRPLLVHTFAAQGNYRNYGMFWEPGAFQGYLILALIFLASARQHLSRERYVRCLLILAAAVLTTMSTTGYVALLVVVFLHLGRGGGYRAHLISRTLLIAYVVLPVLVVGAFLAYRNLPFLEEKIHADLDAARYQEGRWHRGRIGSLAFNWEYIRRRPLTGWGLHSTTRFALHPWMEDSEGMGNGFSDFLAKLGLLGFLTWFLGVSAGSFWLTGRKAMETTVIGIVLLLVLQGECFLGYPLFLGLMFMHPCAPRSRAVPLPLGPYHARGRPRTCRAPSPQPVR
jgi:hypothetical protein